MRAVFLYGFALILVVSTGWAQSTNISGLFTSNFTKAERMYRQQGYRNAIDLYVIALKKDPGNRIAKSRVAECYYRMGQFEEANRWCRRLVNQVPATSEEYFRLGQVLCAMQRYDSAETAFGQALSLDSTNARARSYYSFLKVMPLYHKDPSTYQLTRQWYNSPQSDFSPRHYGSGIVFVSARDRDLFIKRKNLSGISEDEGLLNAFYVDSEMDSERVSNENVELFYSRSLNSPYHDGPVTFYDGGKKIAYTRNLLVNGKPAKDEWGKVNLELYFATLGDNRMLRDLQAFPHNSRSYSIAHPWISEDGLTLYFSSNMPGGKGGADLYVSYLKDKTWTAPQNLGDVVNTPGDEFAPYLWRDQLFFSSDGFGGFGGLDNFVARGKVGSFDKPENLGFPLNSSHDDFGVIIDGEGREGYFASNRLERDDDIYRFVLNRVMIYGQVWETPGNKPVTNAKITVSEEGTKEARILETNAEGNFTTELKVNTTYSFLPEKEGYTALSAIKLRPDRGSILADTLHVALWKHGLFAKGIVYSDELQTKLPGAVVTIENLDNGLVDSVRVSGDGSYRFLVHPNTRYRIMAKYNGYLENGFNLDTKGLYGGDLLNDILLEETYLEKLIVFFEYDKWDLLPEFDKGMSKMMRSLSRNRKATVYIGAHADARGTREYNKRLSDRRADAIVQYLRSKSIEVSRIEAFGFGEELILNTCSDGVVCSDEEHSRNRRAEIKVQLLQDR